MVGSIEKACQKNAEMLHWHKTVRAVDPLPTNRNRGLGGKTAGLLNGRKDYWERGGQEKSLKADPWWWHCTRARGG